MKLIVEKERSQTNLKKKNTFFKLDLAVLAALNRQDCYGYEITTTLKEQTDNLFSLREGVLYPILYKLCEEGKISSENRLVNGRNRVYYHLEEPGKKYMEELLHEYEVGQRLLNHYLTWTGCIDPEDTEGLLMDPQDISSEKENSTEADI